MKVHLRPLEEQDAYTSVKWRNMPELWTHTPFRATKEITIEDELQWIRKVMADPQSKRFAILADDVYVGNIYLTGISDGIGEFHIFIGDKNYWGKGVARQASGQIIAFGKNVLKLHAIELAVKRENAAAFKLYESLGFKETGSDGDFIKMKLDLAAPHK